MKVLDSFINSVLIIDDQENEICALKNYLEKADIYTTYYKNPQELLDSKNIRKKDLIFLDFMLSDDESFTNILSRYIRPILEKHFNKKAPYGIVIWSQHDSENTTIFFEKIYKDSIQDKKYDAPIFIVALDKSSYLRTPTKFKKIINDINVELEKSISASFFLTWNKNVQNGIYQSISGIYHLISNFASREDEVKKFIYKLAVNHKGLPKQDLVEYISEHKLSYDALKAFNDILSSEIKIMQNKQSENLFDNYLLPAETFESKLIDAAQINSKLFLEAIENDKKNVFPGNIYEVIKGNEFIILPKFQQQSRIVVIELTPPCDCASKKIHSRLISGELISFPRTEADWKSLKNKLNFDYIYKVAPICLPNENKEYILYFDLRSICSESTKNLQNRKKYKLFCKAKDPLFADILQKFSAHAARLGLADIKI